jgi:hypothetical protein
LAPVLASLEEIPGVRESRVDWSGRRFLLKLDPEARSEAVVAQANAALGGGARRLGPRAEARASQSYLRGEETWMRGGETLKLSRAEARILAERYGLEAAREAELDEQQTERLVGVMESEIAAAFERIHAQGEGLPANFGPIVDDAIRRTLERSRPFSSAAQLERLEDYCARAFGR